MSGPARKAIRRVAGLSAAVLLSAVCLVAIYAWSGWTGATPESGESDAPMIRLRVPAGTTLSATADSLVAAGLLRHRLIFILGARLSGLDRGIKAGLYEIPAGSAPRDLLGLLVDGVTVQVRLTIPEGTPAVEAARIVGAAMDLDPDIFLARADSLIVERLQAIAGAEDLPADFRLPDPTSDLGLNRPGGYHPCEGYLFPETYSFAEGLTAAAVADALIDQCFATLAQWLDAPGARSLCGNLNRHQIVTLASIVEAETPLDGEKPKVAAVYLNRLRRGMALEADPTIAYATGKTGRRILYADLETPSAYNTYRNRGLPPGPIGNPGEAALGAVLVPEPDFPALYFVADGRGGHVFSTTYAEHQRAVERFRTLRSKERAAESGVR